MNKCKDKEWNEWILREEATLYPHKIKKVNFKTELKVETTGKKVTNKTDTKKPTPRRWKRKGMSAKG